MITSVTVEEVVWRRVSDDRALADLLEDHERERAARRSSPARYITAHALLRSTVGERLGPPRATSSSTAPAPPVEPPPRQAHRGRPPDLSVSLSYAGGVAVVALSRGGEVGVDVEEVDESDFDGFNVATLDASEVPAMDALDGDAQRWGAGACLGAQGGGAQGVGSRAGRRPRQVVVTGPGEPAALGWKGDHRWAVPCRSPMSVRGPRARRRRGAAWSPEPVDVRVVSLSRLSASASRAASGRSASSNAARGEWLSGALSQSSEGRR